MIIIPFEYFILFLFFLHLYCINCFALKTVFFLRLFYEIIILLGQSERIVFLYGLRSPLAVFFKIDDFAKVFRFHHLHDPFKIKRQLIFIKVLSFNPEDFAFFGTSDLSREPVGLVVQHDVPVLLPGLEFFDAAKDRISYLQTGLFFYLSDHRIVEVFFLFHVSARKCQTRPVLLFSVYHKNHIFFINKTDVRDYTFLCSFHRKII